MSHLNYHHLRYFRAVAHDGNLTRAAELFGVPRTTYREKLVRHGLLEA